MAAAFAPPAGGLTTSHRDALATPAARRGVCPAPPPPPPPPGRAALRRRARLVAAAATPPAGDDAAAAAADDADGPSPVEAAKAAAAASAAAADADAGGGGPRFKYDPASPTDAFGRDPKKETEAWMSGAREVLDSPEVRDAIEKHKAEPPPVTAEQQAYLDFIKSLDAKAEGAADAGGGDDPPPAAPES